MTRLTKIEKETIVLFNEGEDKAKSRLSIRFLPPYSEERRQKASEYAKKHGLNSQQG